MSGGRQCVLLGGAGIGYSRLFADIIGWACRPLLHLFCLVELLSLELEVAGHGARLLGTCRAPHTGGFEGLSTGEVRVGEGVAQVGEQRLNDTLGGLVLLLAPDRPSMPHAARVISTTWLV